MRADTAHMEVLGRYAALGARELARLTHHGERSARRWIREGLAPRFVVVFLQLICDGDLSVIGDSWSGWTLRQDGQLHSPEGAHFSPHEIRALPLHHQRMTTLERELELLQEAAKRASTQRPSDFLVRLQQLAAAAATLAAEIAPPSSDLPRGREPLPERQRGEAERGHDQTDYYAFLDARD